MNEMCCICGKELPNRWAVAGRCKIKGCDVPFCSLHWRNGNRQCREHGWSPEDRGQRTEIRDQKTEDGELKSESRDQESEKGDLLKKMFKLSTPNKQQRTTNNFQSEEQGADMSGEQELDLSQVPATQGKKAMEEALKAVKAAGAGLVGLVAKIQYARSPQAMQDTLDENLEKNRARREEVSRKLEAVHNRIVSLKKQYEAAPPVRKRTLQMELKALMGEYKNLEGEFKILLENEEVLGAVRGRFMETLAYDLRGIREKHIDKITDTIELKADEADEIQESMADLVAAGRRRDRDDDVDFDAELAAFGDEEIEMEGDDFQPLEQNVFIAAEAAVDGPDIGNTEPEEKKKDAGLAEPEG